MIKVVTSIKKILCSLLEIDTSTIIMTRICLMKHIPANELTKLTSTIFHTDAVDHMNLIMLIILTDTWSEEAF